MTGPKPVQTTRTGIVADRQVTEKRHANDDEPATPEISAVDDEVARARRRVPAVREKQKSKELTEPKPTKLRERRKRRNRVRSRDKKEASAVVSLQGLMSPDVPKARPRRRHYLMGISFVVMVLIPAAIALAYIYTRAVDAYASTAAFSVHMEENQSAAGLLSGMSALGVAAAQSPDAEILHQFIQSQALVEQIDQELDLRAIYGSAYEQDPVFALDPQASLEELVDYWQRVVTILLVPETGLVTVEVRAFTPEEARGILQQILDRSAALIEELSKIARDDTIRLAHEELDEAAAHLKEMRLEVAQFRDIEQIVDPTADLAGQMGVINALQQSLAEAMIRRDMLIGTTTNDDDPRLQQADRAIAAIETRIENEREKIGARQEDGAIDPLSRVVGEYESLLVDREFAEQSYLAAMAAYDQAMAEARRKSRYLAVHIPPTRAESAIYPRREVISALTISMLLVVWALFILIAYSVRDRR